MELGETVADTARREMLEETTLEIDLPEYPTFMTTDAIFRDDSGIIQYHYVLMHVLGYMRDTHATPQPLDDVSELQWFSPAELAGGEEAGEIVPKTSTVVARAIQLQSLGALNRDNATE